jgi:glycosyltransferase involved in cell wall biosynthesis
MRCPSVGELPATPAGKTGWPWTEGSSPTPDRMPDGRRWPRLTIVTPSLNQGRFIEETIRSVLLQGYPNIEYLVIDGGSTDGTLDVLRTYEKTGAVRWVSEPDGGQAHAIEKGFDESTGEILAWLNADDIYLRKALFTRVALLLDDHPRADMLSAGGVRLFEDGTWERQLSVDVRRLCYRHLRYADYVLQPATFFRRAVVTTTRMDRTLHYAFDWDFFVRASRVHGILGVDEAWAGQRIHATTKTSLGGAARVRELLTVTGRYLGRQSWQYAVVAAMYLGARGVERLPLALRRRLARILVETSAAVSVMAQGKVTPI